MSNKLVIKNRTVDNTSAEMWRSQNVSPENMPLWHVELRAMKTQQTQEKFFLIYFFFSIKSLEGVRVQGRELLPEINFSFQRGMYMAGQAFVKHFFFFLIFLWAPFFPFKASDPYLFLGSRWYLRLNCLVVFESHTCVYLCI